MTAARTCDCGCNHPLAPNARATRRYLDGHRERAYRKRLRERLQAAGLPTSLSLKAADATTTTSNRHTDGPGRPGARRTRRMTPGQVRLSYPRVVATIAAELERRKLVTPTGGAHVAVETWLAPLLTDRQREALHG